MKQGYNLGLFACIRVRTRPITYVSAHLPSFHAGCGLVVDAGFSFTHAVPIFDWHVLEKGVRRMDLGGKALTNQMKTLVSYRCVEVDGM